MRSFSPWLVGMGAIASIVFAIPDFALPGDASGDGEPGRAADSRAVSYLRDVRPILSQHCFQCHGPDEAARKGKLRLDLKEQGHRRAQGASM